MAKRVVLVRHEHGPMDDRVVSFLLMHGLEPDIRYPFAGESLGDVTEDVVATVVYGGNYNAYDSAKHGFLNEEYRWIGAAMDAGIPLLGICQGAQMIAHHHGAWAGPRDPVIYEFGYYLISPTEAGREILPEPLYMAQSHFHTFDLPTGAVRLASSALYENQAFRIGEHVFGFQFHAEQTIEGFRRWQVNKPAVHERPGAQSLAEQTELMYRHDAAQAQWFYGFMSRFLGIATT
jgi:GMP synthase (glutamine-hydrolysing)